MRICTNCGRAYSRKDTYCPYCGRTPHRLGRVCPRGHINPHDATFCAVCGSQELSELAPPAPLWRRLLVIFIIAGILVVLWFIFPLFLSGVLHLIGRVIMRLSHVLLLAAMVFFIPFAVSLFLPKHTGKYLRKVLFGMVRFCLRCMWLAVTSVWRIVAYLASLGSRNMGGSQWRK